MLLDGREVAYLCQVDPRMQAAFDVRLPAYGCWIYLQRIPDYAWQRYRPASKYPSTYRDLALVCDVDVPAAQVEEVIAQAIGTLCTGVRTFDEYRGAQVPTDKKSLAVRVALQRNDATITDEEADAAVERSLHALEDRLNATLRT
jgi:phenylalanyl-tRNA synthetase beta chain